MALYVVEAKSISYVSVLVEADNPEAARERAEDIDGGDFYEDDCGWEFEDTWELDRDVMPISWKGRKIFKANED